MVSIKKPVIGLCKNKEAELGTNIWMEGKMTVRPKTRSSDLGTNPDPLYELISGAEWTQAGG